MTKPTSLAQGRVAHLIEWKGWPKPTDPPSNAHAHFSSYCHLTEGEKEARFAAGSSPPGLPGWLPHPPGSYLSGPAWSRSLWGHLQRRQAPVVRQTANLLKKLSRVNGQPLPLRRRCGNWSSWQQMVACSTLS